MIGTLVGLIFFLIVIGVLWWALQEILKLIPMAEPFATLVRVLMVVLIVVVALYVASVILGMSGIHVGGFPR